MGWRLIPQLLLCARVGSAGSALAQARACSDMRALPRRHLHLDHPPAPTRAPRRPHSASTHRFGSLGSPGEMALFGGAFPVFLNSQAAITMAASRIAAGGRLIAFTKEGGHPSAPAAGGKLRRAASGAQARGVDTCSGVKPRDGRRSG